MAEGYIAAAGNTHLDALLAAYPWIKLHTGAPGAAAAANAAGNTTRKQVTVGAASGGALANTVVLSWTSVSTTEQYTKFSAWSASTNGTCGFTGSVTANAVTAGDDFEAAIGAFTVSVGIAS